MSKDLTINTWICEIIGALSYRIRFIRDTEDINEEITFLDYLDEKFHEMFIHLNKLDNQND